MVLVVYPDYLGYEMVLVVYPDYQGYEMVLVVYPDYLGYEMVLVVYPDYLGYEMVPDMRPDEYDELGGDEQPLDRQDNRSRDTGVPKQILKTNMCKKNVT